MLRRYPSCLLQQFFGRQPVFLSMRLDDMPNTAILFENLEIQSEQLKVKVVTSQCPDLRSRELGFRRTRPNRGKL